MAVPAYRIKGKLENENGYIVVERHLYHETQKNIQCLCCNCGTTFTYKRIYEVEGGNRIALCKRCNELVHNKKTENARFIKE